MGAILKPSTCEADSVRVFPPGSPLACFTGVWPFVPGLMSVCLCVRTCLHARDAVRVAGPTPPLAEGELCFCVRVILWVRDGVCLQRHLTGGRPQKVAWSVIRDSSEARGAVGDWLCRTVTGVMCV